MKEWCTPALFLGLALAWAGQTFGGVMVFAFGCLVAVASLAARLKHPDLRTALHAVAVVALGMYALASDALTSADTLPLEQRAPLLWGALSGLWPALLAASLVPLVFVERARMAQRHAPQLDLRRVRSAAFAGLSASAVVIAACALQYVATRWDAVADVSNAKASEPSEATRKLVASLDTAVTVTTFFPPGSDAGERVARYLELLRADSPKLDVSAKDAALDVAAAREANVQSNGAIVIQHGDKREVFTIPTQVERARPLLRTLDAQVQRRIFQVARASRKIYLTQGHGERSMRAGDGRASVSALVRTLQAQNLSVHELSAAEGLGQEVPGDAAMVAVLGPRQSFSPSEARALEKYETSGGRVLLTFDSEVDIDFSPFLTPLGVRATAGPLAQVDGIANLAPPPSKSDRVNLVSRAFEYHPALGTVARQGMPLLFVAPFGIIDAQAPSVTVRPLVTSAANAWVDANRNFEFDSSEARGAKTLVASVTRAGSAMRALVVGDTDMLSDALFTSMPGTPLFAVDAVQYLVGEDTTIGFASQDSDAPLTQTREQARAWFFATTFGPATLLLAIGVVVRMMRARKS